MNIQKIEEIISKHHQYLKNNDFQGWDELDGLNSRLFQVLPFANNRIARLICIQACKRSVLNLRKLALVPKGENPKGLALFILGLLNLYSIQKNERFIEQALNLYERLITSKYEDNYGIGWGYNFPWQNKVFYVPAYRPNMVVSVFAGKALLELFRHTNDEKFHNQAISVGNFILNNLLLFADKSNACFSYIPDEKAVVHNVNLLGADYFAHLYKSTGNSSYKDIAEKSVRYSVASQESDGAWVYGKENSHKWIDNFHTGYNLLAIYNYQHLCEDFSFELQLKRGLDYHLTNHFTNDLLPKYYSNSLYPLDIHCFAQGIITFLTLKEYIPDNRRKVDLLIKNVLNFLWDNEEHYFYYQKRRYVVNKIPYIRWAQAWMFYSLTYYLNNVN